MAIASLNTNKSAVAAIKEMLKSGKVLVDAGPVINRSAPKARFGAAVVQDEPPPEPSEPTVRILRIVSPVDTYFVAGDNPNVLVETDDAAAVKATVEVDQTFTDLAALSAAFLTAHEAGSAAVAEPPAAFASAFAGAVRYAAPGGFYSQIGLPPEAGGFDAFIQAVADAATMGDRIPVLEIMNSDTRSRHLDLNSEYPTPYPGYLIEVPSQAVLTADEGSAAVAATVLDGEPEDETRYFAGAPAVVILYTGV